MTKLEMIMLQQSEYEQEQQTIQSIERLQNGESIIDYLTQEQIDYIWNKYDNPLGLIDYVDDGIKRRMKQTKISRPFEYTLSIAENHCWPLLKTKGEKKCRSH